MDVREQEMAKPAVTIAAAGRHNLLSVSKTISDPVAPRPLVPAHALEFSRECLIRTDGNLAKRVALHSRSKRRQRRVSRRQGISPQDADDRSQEWKVQNTTKDDEVVRTLQVLATFILVRVSVLTQIESGSGLADGFAFVAD